MNNLSRRLYGPLSGGDGGNGQAANAAATAAALQSQQAAQATQTQQDQWLREQQRLAQQQERTAAAAMLAEQKAKEEMNLQTQNQKLADAEAARQKALAAAAVPYTTDADEANLAKLRVTKSLIGPAANGEDEGLPGFNSVLTRSKKPAPIGGYLGQSNSLTSSRLGRV